jgi:hypothetical protein
MGLKYSGGVPTLPGPWPGVGPVQFRHGVYVLLRMLAALRAYTRSFSMTVNRANVDMQTELHDGDEVACVPRVRGG